MKLHSHPLPLSSSIFIFIFFLIIISKPWEYCLALDPVCHDTCGSLQLKYPFGSGYGCGSPRFHPYVTCSGDSKQLLLTTHTGSYVITSISYATSTLTISPPSMSTCTSMQPSPNLGLDWASPFQLGPSTFLLLACAPPTSSLTVKGSPICDATSTHLCASIYTCPAVIELGLPLFPPTNTCCVYSPANFNGKGELEVRTLGCSGYASVVSVGDYPTDPTRWEYGVALKYTHGAFDSFYMDEKCNTCEVSGGVCGYSPASDNSFVCVCKYGVNTTTDCNRNMQDQEYLWSSTGSVITCDFWLGTVFAVLLLPTFITLFSSFPPCTISA